MLSHRRSNPLLNTPDADPAAAVADYTLLVAEDSGVHGVSSASAMSAAEIWRDFKQDGRLDGNVSTAAASGAVAASTLVPAGGLKTITLIFSWYVPHRTYAGEELGNYYSTLFSSSLDAAKATVS
jgi:uncharacterized protein (DUF608 family)